VLESKKPKTKGTKYKLGEYLCVQDERHIDKMQNLTDWEPVNILQFLPAATTVTTAATTTTTATSTTTTTVTTVTTTTITTTTTAAAATSSLDPSTSP
jgi:hypothetical protein